MSFIEEELKGPATRKECPIVTLKGNSYERGYQYGKQFAQYMEKYYYWFVQKEPKEVLTAEYSSILEKLEETVHKHFPQLFEEIKGRADGAKMPYEKQRLLAFHNDIRTMLNTGCSNFMVSDSPDGPWLARTCDLYEHERSWQVVRISHCDDCLSYMGTTYLGSFSCIGFNEAGLAVGGSSSSSSLPPSTHGLPIPTSCLLATKESTEECCLMAKKVGFTGKGANLAILDCTGVGVIIEYAPGILEIRKMEEDGFLATANHSVTGKIPPSEGVKRLFEDSSGRLSRMTEVLSVASREERTVKLAKKLQGDHQGNMCHHIPEGYHSIYSWIIQLKGKETEMHFCWGYPCEGNYTVIKPEF